MTADAVGGVWRYCVDLLIELLLRRRAEIVLVTMGPRPSAAQRQELEALGGVELVESDFSLEWMPGACRDFTAAGEWLLRLEDEFRPDVIHLNGYAHAALRWRTPVVVVAHSCVYSWWKAVHQSTPGSDWHGYRLGVINGLNAASAIVAPSRSMASTLVELYNLSANDIEVISNFSRDTLVVQEAKQHFGLAAGRMWDEAKNLKLLEQVAPAVDLPIRVAGDDKGPDGRRVEARSVDLLGPLRHYDLLREMGRAETFLHPAVYEPFGIAVLEAARSSCALLLADIDSLRELWGRAAVFVDARDPERWIFELRRLSADRLRTKQLGEWARVHAERFDAADSAIRYWDVYDSLRQGVARKRSENYTVAV